MIPVKPAVAIAALTAALTAGVGAQDSGRERPFEMAPDQFDALHRLIKPGPDELKWLEIPWLTSLWEARKKGAEEGKPVFLWSMDGTPMGTS